MPVAFTWEPNGIGFAVPANLARTVVEQLVSTGRVVRGWTGITKISDLTEETGGEPGEGVVIVELLRGSPAHRGGVEPGDIVVSVDGHPIGTAAQLRNALAASKVGTDLRFVVRREGRRVELTVRVEEARGRG